MEAFGCFPGLEPAETGQPLPALAQEIEIWVILSETGLTIPSTRLIMPFPLANATRGDFEPKERINVENRG